MEEWKLRLRQAREAKGMNKTEFAKAVGVSNATVTDWEKSSNDGGIKVISGIKLTKACLVLGIDANWLLHGAGRSPDMPDDLGAVRGQFIPVRVADADDPAVVHIQKVKLRLSAGINGFQVEPEPHDGTTLTVPTAWVERRGYSKEKLVAIRVKGESMEPTLYEDDLVIINTQDKLPVDGAVYAFNYEGEPVVKRMERDAGDWWLRSDNPDQRKFGRKVCRGDACLIVGRVVRRESDHI